MTNRTFLDDLRRQAGVVGANTVHGTSAAAGAARVTLASVAHAGRTMGPAGLEHQSRVFLGWMTALTIPLIVANWGLRIVMPAVVDASNPLHGASEFGLSVIGFPLPIVQQILIGITGAAIAGIGMVTGWFSSVPARLARALQGIIVAGVVVCAPTVLVTAAVLAIAVLFIALAVALGVVLVIGFFALMLESMGS